LSAYSDLHTKGLMLTAFGGLVLSVDIPLILLAKGEPWTILMLRTGTTFIVALAVWFIWRSLKGNAPALIPGKTGVAVAVLYGLSSITFITAVFNTSTANLVFILAFNTVFAALLSWGFLKERPRPVTFAAMALMVLGVLIIVGDSAGSGNLFGDVIALISTFFLASAITISRASGKDMGFAALMGVILPFSVAAFMVVGTTGIQVEAPWWIILNGAVIIPIAFFCLANGPKYISAPEVAMFYLLETILAPIWVWMVFAEIPSRNSLIGGTILIVTLVAHSLWQIAHGRKRRAAAMVRHPT
jgi:drug/metabolite transporter (DMT)-like permease